MSTVAIVQARMGSTRLPGKVLKKLADRSVLGHVITRLQAVHEINKIIVATTIAEKDDPIVEEANRYNIKVYRGSEEDVLSRYYESAREVGAGTIVRVTSDCPLIDPEVTGEIIRYFFSQQTDYASNTLTRTFPRGLDVEVFSFDAIEKAYREANKSEQREHVTPYMYQNPQKFKLANYIGERDYSTYRWTLDVQEDWKLIEQIYQKLYKPNQIFSWKEVIHLMQQEPELKLINLHVGQKKLGE